MYLIVKVVLFFPLLSNLIQDGGGKIIGTWAINDQTHVEIYPSGNTFSIKVAWLAEPLNHNGLPKVDKNNPNRQLRSRQILGLILAEGIQYSKGIWKGRIYSPERGSYAECRFELSDERTITMTATKGLFSSTKTWKKL